MKPGENKVLDYYTGLYFKTSAPPELLKVSLEGIISIIANPTDVVRVYINVLNSFDAIIKTIPIDILPKDKDPNTYISIYVD